MADDEIMIEAIRKRPSIIRVIPTPTWEMLCVAIQEDNDIFKDLKKKNRYLAKKILEDYGCLLKYYTYEEQTLPIIALAISNDMSALKYVAEDKLSEEMKKEIIQLDPTAIEHIKNPSEDLCIEAVEGDPEVIKFIKNQTPKICNIVLNKCPLLIFHFNDQTKEYCNKALRKDPAAIKGIEKPTADMILYAVYKDPSLLTHVEQNLELCITCVIVNPDCIGYIKNGDTLTKCHLELTEIISIGEY